MKWGHFDRAKLYARQYVNRRGLDLSKEVLWFSLSQSAAKLQAVENGGLEKILPLGLPCTKFGHQMVRYPRRCEHLQSLMDHIFSALSPTKTHVSLWKELKLL